MFALFQVSKNELYSNTVRKEKGGGKRKKESAFLRLKDVIRFGKDLQASINGRGKKGETSWELSFHVVRGK